MRWLCLVRKKVQLRLLPTTLALFLKLELPRVLDPLFWG